MDTTQKMKSNKIQSPPTANISSPPNNKLTETIHNCRMRLLILLPFLKFRAQGIIGLYFKIKMQDMKSLFSLIWQRQIKDMWQSLDGKKSIKVMSRIYHQGPLILKLQLLILSK